MFLEYSRKVRYTFESVFFFFPFLCPLTIRALVTHWQLFTPLAGTCGDLLRLVSFCRIFVFLDEVVLEGYRTACVWWQSTLHPHFHSFEVITVRNHLKIFWIVRNCLRILLCCTQSRWSIRQFFPWDFTTCKRDHWIFHFLRGWWDTICTFPARSELARILWVFRRLWRWSLEHVRDAR